MNTDFSLFCRGVSMLRPIEEKVDLVFNPRRAMKRAAALLHGHSRNL